MNTNIKTAAKLVAFAGAFALTGCAFVPDTVHPTYTPPANVAKVPGADKVTVDVVVKNEKKHKNEVSVTKDGYGIPMAGVYMHVANDFTKAITTALEKEGFAVSKDGDVGVYVDVVHFYLPEQMHWWSESHTGHGSLKVVIKNKSGAVIYDNHVAVKNIYFDRKSNLENFNLTSVGRAESAKMLMSKMVNKLIHDRQFIDALLKAAPEKDGVTVQNIP